MFASNFAPRGWALCEGQLLPISQNSALFSLFGTIYGGDGRTTLALPDCRGRIPLHRGAGPGLTPRLQGSRGGAEAVTLTLSQLPSHSHQLQAVNEPADSGSPAGRMLADPSVNDPIYSDQTNQPVNMSSESVSNAGSGQSHSNLMPTLCVNFIVALTGIFPSRS